MKLVINKKRLNLNPDAFLRRAGYAFIHDDKMNKDSFVRRFTRDFYPRFHVYFEDLNDRVIINLHLDQKRASYSGSHMHSAEYEGPSVEAEIDRLKGFIIEESQGGGFSLDLPEDNSVSAKSSREGFVGHGNIEDAPKVEKKSWWRKIFGI
jgi:hypothetical protein